MAIPILRFGATWARMCAFINRLDLSGLRLDENEIRRDLDFGRD